mgnify:CR=1 FL=1
MGLFNFDKNAILGTVFKAASNVMSTASRALGSAARTSARASKVASSIGKSRPSVPTGSTPSTPSASVPAPVKPVQTSIEPPIVKPISADSDRPAPTIMPETITPDAATIGKLMAEIEKLKKERDFLLQQNQQPKESKPFGAASVSSDASTFEQQMDVAAAIDAKRAANPEGDEKELRQQAIDEYYYPEDESEGFPDDIDELAGLEPGPIPF